MSKFKKADLSKVKTIKVSDRKTKAEITRIGKPCDPEISLSGFFQSLPDYLKASDLFQVAESIAGARMQNSAIIWMMGAHPIKIGLSDVIVDLARNKFITHMAFNGAGVIHDFEMAFFGRTSEEVADGLADGSFGMVEETPSLIFEAARLGSENGLGLGEGVGKYIADKAPAFADHSILCQLYKLGIPVSVHVAIGTDTICQHPGFDGAVFGKLSHDDFRLLCESVITLGGGAVINIGSAVILPEVFLKALTVSRNIHGKPQNFTAVNFDMIQHYRPNTNVVNRPTAQIGWEVATGYPWGFWSGGNFDFIKEGKERFASKTAKIRAQANKLGIYLAHEIHPGTAAMCADDFNMLVEACDGDKCLTVNADPSHCWEGEDWETRFLKVAPRIYACHVKNFVIRKGLPLRMADPSWQKRAMQFVDIPTGDLNMTRYVELLMHVGYPQRYCEIMKTSTAPLIVEAESAYRDVDATSANGIQFVRDNLCFPTASGSFEDGMGA